MACASAADVVIASEPGYSDFNNFRAAFQKQFGAVITYKCSGVRCIPTRRGSVDRKMQTGILKRIDIAFERYRVPLAYSRQVTSLTAMGP